MLTALGIGLIPLIYAFNHPSPYNTISAFCKARNYLLQVSAMMYRWLMVAACIDRCIHTLINPRLQSMITVRVTGRIIGVIVLLCSILPFHQLVWTDVQGKACVFTDTTAAIYSGFFTMIAGGLLPPLIMFGCAILIRYNLAQKRDRLDAHRDPMRRVHSDGYDNCVVRARDQQALVMLLIQVLVYTISNLPWTINLVYTAFTRFQIKSASHLLIESFLRSLAEFIWYMYPVLSFYMYTLVSRTFRRELIRIFRSVSVCQHRPVRFDQRIRPAG